MAVALAAHTLRMVVLRVSSGPACTVGLIGWWFVNWGLGIWALRVELYSCMHSLGNIRFGDRVVDGAVSMPVCIAHVLMCVRMPRESHDFFVLILVE